MSEVKVIYSLLLFSYSLFFFTVRSGYRNKAGHLKDILEKNGNPGLLLNRLVDGTIILGTGTAGVLAFSISDYSIFDFPSDRAAWYHPLIAALALMTGFFSALVKRIYNENSPQTLPSFLPFRFLVIRTLFLIAYECFFRGVLLFTMMENTGLFMAVFINIILYVAVHWFDKKERIGSVPMGLTLCLVTILSRSVWPAIIIHLSLALGHEITLLVKYHSLIKNVKS